MTSRWVIKGHWTIADNNVARSQGWCVSRQHTRSEYCLRFTSPRGQRKFEKAIAQERRFHMRALRAVAVAALLGEEDKS